jgi:Putative zinc-finger
MAERKKGQKLSTNKTCKQMTDLIFDYLNDKLSPTVKRNFQQHLKICPDCVNFLSTYKKTVSVSRSIRSEEIPTRVRNNILNFLRLRTRKSGTSS